MTVSLDALLLPLTANLRTALSVIDANGAGAAFVVGTGGRLEGVVTDGDIRRGLLRGATLDSAISSVMRSDYVSLRYDAAPEQILSAFTARLRLIPLVDERNRLVDYATRHRQHRLPVAEPDLQGNELTYIIECVTTNWISSQGPFIHRFEGDFARWLDAPNALAVSSGTAALHLALTALGIGPGDEVLVPDLTFAASINAVLYVGATPVLVDVRRDTWTIDLERAESLISPRTRAIMVVHLYGQPCDMNAVASLTARHGLLVIEDVAEAMGAEFSGRAAGTFGDAAAFSFFGNKLMTTGEGGMVVFRNSEAAARARVLRDHGMNPQRRYWHDQVGFNYRLTNLQAAVGVAQLERIDSFLERKLRLGARYTKGLAGVPGLVLPVTLPDTRNVFWLYSVALDDAVGCCTRDELMRRLLLHGIDTRPLFHPLHQMPPYRSFGQERAFPHSTRLAQNGFSLPSAVTMDDGDVDYVVGALKRALAAGALAS